MVLDGPNQNVVKTGQTDDLHLFNAYNTKPDENGNITVTFSIEDPEDGTYWMPVTAGEPHYFVVRYYKPDVSKLPPKPCN